MKVRKFAALLAAITLIAAMAVGISTPASAQGWHHGGYYHHGPVYYHGGPRFYHPRAGFYPAPGTYHRPVYYRRPVYYGPGYVHYSWAWYRRHPAYWRAEHPYHGSPTLGVWIHL